MATVNEQIVTGKKFRKLINETNKLWQRISFWTKASDVEFNDGKTAETKVGAISGITSDINGESENIAASIKVVNQLNSNLGSYDTKVVDYTTINNNVGGSYFSSGGILISYNRYFVQISIRLYFNITFVAGNNYGFGVPASIPWSKIGMEKMGVTPNGARFSISIQNDATTFSITPSTQINAGDTMREEFFCLRS